MSKHFPYKDNRLSTTKRDNPVTVGSSSVQQPLLSKAQATETVEEHDMSAYRTERQRLLRLWGMIFRLAGATGLALYLTIDAIAISFVPVPALTFVLAGYIALNGTLWFTLPSESASILWMCASLDMLALTSALIILPPVWLPDPLFATVALFALFLMYYASYGSPSLNAALSLGALACTTALMFAPLPGLEHFQATGDDAVRGFLMVQYVSIASLVTCLMALHMRKQSRSHTAEIIRRKRAAVQAACERARRQEAERLDELKQDFIRVISHELRNPMTPLKSSLEIVRDQMKAGEIDEEMLEVSMEAAVSLEELVNDYTQLAKLLTQHEDAATKCNIRLDMLLMELVTDIPHLDTDLTPIRQLSTCADPILLTEALRALLRRACQHVKSDNLLTISGTANDKSTRLHIHNSADPFSQLEDALDDPFSPLEERIYFSEGTGLELILARHGLRQLGGRLEIEQEIQGTTITCHLPPEGEDAPWLNAAQLQDLRALA